MTSAGTVLIVGAGTMGAGIAQVAAAAGWHVRLRDVDAATAERAIASSEERFGRLVEKGRMSEAERSAASARLSAGGDASGCNLVIEAVVEDLAVKTTVLRALLPSLPRHAIIATNTSSLSVSDLGAALGEGRRTVGMHFFNPAPLLALVEIVAGGETDPAITDRAAQIARAWGKTVVRSADVPGFIVNHVARPYYLEAFRILEERLADPRTIDDAMKALGGFRMGPLELTDLIGQDVNTATTRSVWSRLGEPALLRPSELQEALVSEGHLGRKTGRGVYDYSSDKPCVAIDVDPRPLRLPSRLTRAVARFVDGACVEGSLARADDRSRYVFARILAALIAQARLAHERGVASPDDIDTALRLGANYPRGPFEWSGAIGDDVCDELIDALEGVQPQTPLPAPRGEAG